AISEPNDSSEQEAEAVAHGFGQPANRRAAPSAAIHRAPPPTATDEDKKTSNLDPNASTSTPAPPAGGVDTATPKPADTPQNSTPATPAATPGTGTNDVPTAPGGGFIGPPLPDQPGPVQVPDVTPAASDPGGNGG